MCFLLREHKTVIDPTQSSNELLGHAAGTPIAAFQPGVMKVPPPLPALKNVERRARRIRREAKSFVSHLER